MNDRARKKAVELVARQIAMNSGYVWGRVPGTPSMQQLKVQAGYVTLASSILATVERMADVRWKGLPDADES